MAGEHSVLSPSKGEMILSCPAALGASKGVKDEPSRFAAEGTAYHDIAAKVLQGLQWGTPGSTCENYVGAKTFYDGFHFVIDEDNAAYAQVYVDRIRALGGLQFYEQRLDTSQVVGVPGQGGTTDAVILDFEHDTIRIRDLKFGKRPVYAPGNKQYLQYGAAALRKYGLLHDWKALEVGTEQPRINHFDTWTYTVVEVEAWIAENKPKFQRAYELYLDPSKITAADFNPTEKGCEWCPIRDKCAARNSKFMELFPKVSAKPLITMTNADLGEARTLVEKFEAWASSIKAEAHRRAVEQGEKLPGWKVVQGRRGNRKWEGEGVEATLASHLGDDAYKPREIVTPTEAEKRFKKAKKEFAAMAPFITQSEGTLSLEREDAAKPEIKTGTEFPIQEIA